MRTRHGHANEFKFFDQSLAHLIEGRGAEIPQDLRADGLEIIVLCTGLAIVALRQPDDTTCVLLVAINDRDDIAEGDLIGFTGQSKAPAAPFCARE